MLDGMGRSLAGCLGRGFPFFQITDQYLVPLDFFGKSL
jgi:hypothetical protein